MLWNIAFALHCKSRLPAYWICSNSVLFEITLTMVTNLFEPKNSVIVRLFPICVAWRGFCVAHRAQLCVNTPTDQQQFPTFFSLKPEADFLEDPVAWNQTMNVYAVTIFGDRVFSHDEITELQRLAAMGETPMIQQRLAGTHGTIAHLSRWWRWCMQKN